MQNRSAAKGCNQTLTAETQRAQRSPEPQPKPFLDHEGHEDDEAKKKVDHHDHAILLSFYSVVFLRALRVLRGEFLIFCQEIAR